MQLSRIIYITIVINILVSASVTVFIVSLYSTSKSPVELAKEHKEAAEIIGPTLKSYPEYTPFLQTMEK